MKKIGLMFILAILIISCKRDKNMINDGEILNKEMKTLFEFYFQDTLKVNKTYGGVIVYKSHLDTLTTSLFQEEIDTSRLLVFYLKHNKEQIVESYQHIIKDTSALLFSSKSIDSIYFEYEFKQTGNYYLEGVLEDEVLFSTLNKEEPLRTIVKYKHVTFPVFVTDDDSILDKEGSLIRMNDGEKGVPLFYKKE